MSDFSKELRGWILIIVVAFAIALLLRMYIIQPYRVEMTSMVSTLEPNDLVLVEKISYKFSKPHRGDVVVFRPPNDSTSMYIKRVIGLPGDTISIANDTVYINGKPLEEPYVHSPMADMPETAIPEGKVFVMGDNRSVSLDSRSFGPIEISSIIGRAVLVYWPLNHIQTLLAYSGENP